MLKQILDKNLRETSLRELKKSLDYNSSKRLKKSIEQFLTTKTIYDWLNSGFYDLINNAEDFLIKLCRVFKIVNEILQREVFACRELKIEIDKFKDAYLFVNTNFKRKSEPIFALAMLENKRRVSLYNDERFLFKTIDEILSIISSIVINHYKLNNGKCFIWGDIVNYQLYIFREIYTFSIDGKLINSPYRLDINNASIRLKNKKH